MNDKPTPPDGNPALGGVASSQPKSARELTLERLGKCEAVICNDPCIGGFAYHNTMDFFRMCVCGHTQQSHGRAES